MEEAPTPPRKSYWPMAGLGLGTPLNLASLSPRLRASVWRRTPLWLLLGAATAALVIGLDQVLFAGVSLERVRTVGELPLGQRAGIALVAAVSEEVIFRLLYATAVASLAFLVLRRRARHARAIAVWVGILVACVLFGLAHVGNLPDVPHPYLRAITLNGVAGLVLGWLYWYRGLEAAIITHLGADVAIYLGLTSFL